MSNGFMSIREYNNKISKDLHYVALAAIAGSAGYSRDNEVYAFTSVWRDKSGMKRGIMPYFRVNGMVDGKLDIEMLSTESEEFARVRAFVKDSGALNDDSLSGFFLTYRDATRMLLKRLEGKSPVTETAGFQVDDIQHDPVEVSGYRFHGALNVEPARSAQAVPA
jgi:hypothetical protein